MKPFANFILANRRREQGRAAPTGRVRKPGDLRIVAVTRALDEADIIEAFIRHTATYVTHHIVIDNGSSDGTADILQKLREEGLSLTVFRNRSVSYVEQSSNRFLFDQAVDRDADWVLFLDADEFLDDRRVIGGFRGIVESFGIEPPYQEGLLIPVYNYVLSSKDDDNEVIAPRRLHHRLDKSYSSHVSLPATLVGRSLIIANGAHFATYDEGSPVACYPRDGLVIAHYSIRSTYQSLAKAIKGWAKVLAAGPAEIARGTSCHYRGVFEALRDRPHELFGNEGFMAGIEDASRLQCDPIDYRGGDLRYTIEVDHPMRAVKGLVGYVEDLAKEFGILLEASREARTLVAARDAVHERL